MALNFGATLLSDQDLVVLRKVVKLASAGVQGRPMRGVEVGPWLGRSTVTLLAPDLQLGANMSLDPVVYELTTRDPGNPDTLVQRIEQALTQCSIGWQAQMFRHWLMQLVAQQVRPQPPYFETLWVIDTWGGIASERTLYFKNRHPRALFELNMKIAGFEDVVKVLQGGAMEVMNQVPDPVDFVFLDGDHEYEAVVRDLYAVREHLTPQTLLCGHDVALRERWPGVELALNRFVGEYQVAANVWIALPQGIEKLQAMPPYEQFQEEVAEETRRQARRYENSAFREKYGLPAMAS